MIRFQSVVLPLLRAALGETVNVVSVMPDVDERELPMVSVRRVGGARNGKMPEGFDQPVVEMTAVSGDGFIEAEELYSDALEALYAAVRAQQTVPGVGYLHSIVEQQGPITGPLGLNDLWSVKGMVKLGVRAEL